MKPCGAAIRVAVTVVASMLAGQRVHGQRPVAPAYAWTFDGGTGAVARPAAGGVVGEIDGATWSREGALDYPGNRSLYFDGRAATVSLRGVRLADRDGRPVTIGAWLYCDGGVDRRSSLFGNWFGGKGRQCLLLQEVQGGLARFIVRVGSEGYATDPVSVPRQSWVHLAAVWKPGTDRAGSIAFFVGGERVSTKSPVPPLRSLPDEGAYVVGNAPGRDASERRAFKGYIDELAVWHAALTDEQVAWLSRNSAVQRGADVRPAPRPVGPPVFSFVQFSDVHVGNKNNLPVHDRLVAAVGLVNARKPAFVIDTGDMTTHPVYGAEPEYLAELDAYRRYTDKLTVPLHTVPGNHDIGYSHPKRPRSNGEPWGDHAQLVAAYRKKIGPLDQSFGHGGFRFLLLNNNPTSSKEPGHLSATQLAWIEDELKRGQPAFIFCHVQTLENGTGEPWGDSAARLARLCSRYGVAAVGYGHRHELHVTELGGTAYIMCPDLKVQGHQSVLEYRVYADCFELWRLDVLTGTEARVARHRYTTAPRETPE